MKIYFDELKAARQCIEFPADNPVTIGPDPGPNGLKAATGSCRWRGVRRFFAKNNQCKLHRPTLVYMALLIWDRWMNTSKHHDFQQKLSNAPCGFITASIPEGRWSAAEHYQNFGEGALAE